MILNKNACVLKWAEWNSNEVKSKKNIFYLKNKIILKRIQAQVDDIENCESFPILIYLRIFRLCFDLMKGNFFFLHIIYNIFEQ
jgi:hypothetical protein